MPTRTDGSEIPRSEALPTWASAAYEELKRIAHTYNKTVNYKELSEHVQQQTDITTRQQLNYWIGHVLELVAETAAAHNEPPLSALCVHADGTIGDGYDRAPKFADASTADDVDQRAAEDRLLCYRKFATDLPSDGGTPTLTPRVAIGRRSPDDTRWIDAIHEKGHLQVSDKIPFRTHVEVAQLFGLDYRGHQRARIKLDDYTQVWFPKLYPNKDWVNELSLDGTSITMTHQAGGGYGDAMNQDLPTGYVITFAHVRTGQSRHYEFVGVFEIVQHMSNHSRWVYQRVADTITFDSLKHPTFSPERTKKLQDDQSAEALTPDPELVKQAQAQLDAGQYAAEDQLGVSKVRGSYQAVFAKRVKDNYGWECAVTGISTPEFLIASHIVPWSEDKEIRTDPTNGICLSVFVDRAFDAGFLEITPEHQLVVRWDRIPEDPILKFELRKFDGSDLKMPIADPPDPAKLARRIELGY